MTSTCSSHSFTICSAGVSLAAFLAGGKPPAGKRVVGGAMDRLLELPAATSILGGKCVSSPRSFERATTERATTVY